jgi:DNA-binding SARP family transcriptional activator/tetratricopeptide (TPR) repeat protein
MDDLREIPRPALKRRLDAALGRRLTLVTAPPGSGKTTLLTRWSRTVHATWCAPRGQDLVGLVGGVVDALRLRAPGLAPDVAATLGGGRGSVADQSQAVAAASAISDALTTSLTRDLVLILDDVDLDPGAPRRFIAELVRQAPRHLHVVISGRDDPGIPTARLAEQGELLELHGRDLTLDVHEVAEWLAVLVDASATTRDAAPQVHAMTGGWPLAVRHVANLLASTPADGRAAALARISEDDLDMGALVSTALASEPEAARELLRALTVLPEVAPALCDWLGLTDGEDLIARLERGGLFVQSRPDAPGSVRLRPLVLGHVAEALPLDPDRARTILRRAADWFGGRGRHAQALQCLRDADDPSALATYLRAHGQQAAEQGEISAVQAALSALPPGHAGPWSQELNGVVLHLLGDWDGALDAFDAAGRADPVVAATSAWRVGLIHHMRGETEKADLAYRRGQDALSGLPAGAVDPSAVALLHAWWASTRWLRADRDGCRELALQAVDEATAAGDDRGLAAAHTALAMLAALDGDRPTNDAHYLRALEHAERASDLLQIIRIRTNRGSHHLEEGATHEAMAELDVALRLAELAGFAVFRAIALTNRGEAQLAMGHFELARADVERGLEEWEQQGSRMKSYALRLLSELEVRRGDLARARQMLEEAIELCEPAGDMQGIIPAAAELARLLVVDDPEAAVRYRDLALSSENSIDRVRALVAAAEVALALGDLEDAAAWAEQARELAARRRDPSGEVDALLVLARMANDDEARALLSDAASVLGPHGDPVRRAWIDLASAERSDPAVAVELATGVRDRMRALGVGQLDAAASALLRRLDEDVADLEIETFGGFRLIRRGEPVGVQQWQSRKARDLLKILVARRGRPVPRDELVELLWPGEDSGRLADRLNVTMSTLRGVLDPDREHPADHVVVSAEGAVHLDLDHVAVDLELLLDDVAQADRLHRAGRVAEALERDRRVVATHRGGFLEEHAYDDWAVPAREQARAAFLASARRLASAAASEGDVDAEVRYLLRTLEHDPYDEPTHLRLVRTLHGAGRHGEARRAYQRYTARMVELDIEPAAYPAG